MLESNIQIHIGRQAIHPVRRSNGTTAARKVWAQATTVYIKQEGEKVHKD
jgi:hypothetical protein